MNIFRTSEKLCLYNNLFNNINGFKPVYLDKNKDENCKKLLLNRIFLPEHIITNAPSKYILISEIKKV